MTSGRRIPVTLLLLLLAGCQHRQQNAAARQQAQAPALPPSQMASQIPATPPPLPSATPRPIKLDTTPPPEPPPKVAAAPKPDHTVVKHRKKTPAPAEAANGQEKPAPASTAAAPATTQNQTTQQVQEAANGGQPSEMSPIGQLSTANDTADSADRHTLADQITATETKLNGIKRALTDDEQKTATQIRTYITRARDALKADDLDGARVQSAKAKQLLDELTQP